MSENVTSKEKSGSEVKTNLKEAEATISIIGVVSENNLEVKTIDGKEVMTGNIVVQTSDVNFVTVSAYAGKLTKEGKDSKVFVGLETVMKEHKSIADVGKEEATIVDFTAQIRPNTYFDDNGKHEVMRYSSNFFSRAKEEKEFKAEFALEMFIQSIVPEVYTTGDNTGDETGRLLVKGYLPIYNNGIEPIEVVVPQELASAVDGLLEVGQTVRITGDVVNNKIVKTVEIPVAIGKPQIKTTTTYKNELILTGCSEPYEDEAAYNIETIKQALAAREEKLVEMEAKAKSGTKTETKKTSTAKKTGRSLPF